MWTGVVEQGLHLRRTVDSAAAHGGVREVPYDGAATSAGAAGFGIDLSKKFVRYVDNNPLHIGHYASVKGGCAGFRCRGNMPHGFQPIST